MRIDTVFLYSIEHEMYFLIVTMREKGVAKTWPAIRAEVPIRADVNIRNGPCEFLNRSCEIAEVRFSTWPLNAPAFSPLYDARISGMATNGFSISGLEEVDGVLYAQSWYCRPEN
ncbi:hypothetical protein [Pseudomonas sp. SMN5]|uniref:hypothetical protein n=1 Tax=Pseudomonas sp. SMN5 TaxID=3390198 RepID=UPI003F84E787